MLGKYDVQYYRCKETGFIQTESPYWLQEAYSSAISALDVGCVTRNLQFARSTKEIIEKRFPADGQFLDYGGGTGLFVRLMRDEGFPFLRSDLYCENIFARGFDLSDRDPDFQDSFVLLTAFELFEHFEHPKCQIEKMFGLSDTILFSTELQPDRELTSADDWWYFVPETGQHIAFYNLRSLEYLADHFGARLYSNGASLHMMTRSASLEDPFTSLAASRTLHARVLRRLISACRRIFSSRQRSARGSLTWPDFELVRSRLSGRPKGK